MKDGLLELLVCPACLADLCDTRHPSGDLTCVGCSNSYPVVNGVPQMLVNLDPQRKAIAHGFGEQWKRYSHFKQDGEKQFLDWLKPVGPDFFSGKIVLDGGCGRGHHAAFSSRFGAATVVGVDLGEGSTEVAHASNLDDPNVHIVRADLMALPFRPGTFDYAYSVGVLHHLPDPEAGFKSVLSRVKPGGHISAWVYGLENNEWITSYLDPLRTGLFSKLPRPLLSFLSRLSALLIIAITRGVYQPVLRLFPELKLFYRDYLMYIADFPLRDIETIVYDHLQPSVAFYLSKEEFSGWFEGLSDTVIGWHNSNSWRGFARVPNAS